MLSRPLVLMELLATIIIALICFFAVPGAASTTLFSSSLALAFLYIAYFCLGIIKFGLTRQRLLFLAGVPLTIVNLAFISLLGVFGFKKDIWARTPRG